MNVKVDDITELEKKLSALKKDVAFLNVKITELEDKNRALLDELERIKNNPRGLWKNMMDITFAYNDQLKDALKPFASYVLSTATKNFPDEMVITMGSPFARAQLTIGHCRKALEVLNAKE